MIKVSIIGLGLIGGSLAKAFKKSDISIHISAFDQTETLTQAYKENIIDEELDNIEDALKSEIIFLCLPVDLSIQYFTELSPIIKFGQTISDVCGVKFPFQKIWNYSNSKGRYIGGHPMTGKEVGGYKNSDPLLFENCVYTLTEDLSKSDDDIFRTVISTLGANILHIPSKQHDLIAASVSHLPQLVSVALVNAASLKTEDYNFLDLAAGGFRDMTRIASSDFNIWQPVIKENKNEIITALEKFQLELDKIKSKISDNKLEFIEDYFESARKLRDEIPQNTKGFLNPLFDIYVFTKDEPGSISKISSALFEKGINIKDIELLKIREGTGGTFRLSFDTKLNSDAAKNILLNIGFTVE